MLLTVLNNMVLKEFSVLWISSDAEEISLKTQKSFTYFMQQFFQTSVNRLSSVKQEELSFKVCLKLTSQTSGMSQEHISKQVVRALDN